MSYTKGYRYSIVPGSDNSKLFTSKEIKAIAYAASIALAPTQEKTTIEIGQLTGALSITADVVVPYAGDELLLVFSADGTNRVVTFSTGFTTAGTLTVTASKEATATFVFASATSTWVEKSRVITA